MALLVASVLIGLYGERLTRLLVLGVFVGLAMLLGRYVAEGMSLPSWPTTLLMGALGGIVAHLFYTWFLGVVLAVVLAAAAGAWSVGAYLDSNELRGALSDVQAIVVGHPLADGRGEGFSGSAEALFGGSGKSPGGTSGAAEPLLGVQAGDVLKRVERLVQRVQGVWSDLAAKPDAQKNLLITMLAGAAIGLFAGLVLGRVAAILLTSVLASIGLVCASVSLAVWYEPQLSEQLSSHRQHLLIAAAAAALLFFLRQAVSRPGCAGSGCCRRPGGLFVRQIVELPGCDVKPSRAGSLRQGACGRFRASGRIIVQSWNHTFIEQTGSASPFLGACVLVAGVIILLLGWRVSRLVAVLDFSLFGAILGGGISAGSELQWLGAGLGAVLLGLVALWLDRRSEFIACGLIAAVMVAVLAGTLTMPLSAVLLLAAVTFGCGVAMTSVANREATAVITAAQGGLLASFGMSACMAWSGPFWSTMREVTAHSGLMQMLFVLGPIGVGVSFQLASIQHDRSFTG